MEYRILETQYKGIDPKFQPQCRNFGDKEWRDLTAGCYKSYNEAKKEIDDYRAYKDDNQIVRTVVHEFT